MKEYTVKEVASLFEKHEETIKRWIRSGKLPNSYRNSDKEGWRIIESDLLELKDVIHSNRESYIKNNLISSSDVSELVKLAYQAVTLNTPTDEVLNILTRQGIKRTLQILLIMQQSSTKVRNPEGFIKKAIREDWTPTSTPVNLPKKESKRLYDLTASQYKEYSLERDKKVTKVPFYNWLEE